MKTLVRAGMLVTLLLAGAPLAAQDASTAPAAEPAAPAPPMTDDDALRALADGPAAAPVDVQTAPADPPPSDAPDPGPVEAAAAVANREATPEASAVESAPLPPPPEIAPAVGVSAATSFTAAAEAPRRRHGSDWIFVGIVALAAVGILRKFAREPIESVSIHGAAEASANPPIAEAPPILRKR